jgi:hypothetical protein
LTVDSKRENGESISRRDGQQSPGQVDSVAVDALLSVIKSIPSPEDLTRNELLDKFYRDSDEIFKQLDLKRLTRNELIDTFLRDSYEIFE